MPDTWLAAGATSSPVAVGASLDLSASLETVVECEPVRDATMFAPRLTAEAGLHFLRLLSESGSSRALRQPVIAAVPIELVADPSLDEDTRRFLSVVVGRAPDGAVLSSVLTIVTGQKTIAAFDEPYKSRVATALEKWQTWLTSLTAADRAAVAMATTRYLEWYRALFNEPRPQSPPSWRSDRLEYEIVVSAPTPQQEVVLTVPEYAGGRLDWYSFDIAGKGSLSAARSDLEPDDLTREPVRWSAIPTQSRYPGMPNARYWEFEDAKIDFGAIAIGTQQLAHAVLVEFALVSGDDWWIIPVDMAVGSVAAVRWLTITDTFGERTLIPSARQVDGVDAHGTTEAWDMFRLSPDPRFGARSTAAAQDVFLLPPTLGPRLHGASLEDVRLLRDEMANMAWAVERVIESPLNQPFDRAEAFHRSRPGAPEPANFVTAAEARPLTYRLASDVPAYWLPLYPTRLRPGAPPLTLLRGGTPLGRILEPTRTAVQNPMVICEEEVPREGTRVTRAFQYARWIDGGRIYGWLAGKRLAEARGRAAFVLMF